MAAQSKFTKNQSSKTSGKSTGTALNTPCALANSFQLNTVMKAFAGLCQVISGYSQEGERLNEMAEDDLNSEREAYSVPLTDTNTDTEAKSCMTNNAALFELPATQLATATDGTASSPMPNALNLRAVKEASKSVSNNMLRNYQRCDSIKLDSTIRPETKLREHSQEWMSFQTTETVTLTQHFETLNSPLSSDRQLETRTLEEPDSTILPSKPTSPMTTQSTNASLQDLITVLHTLQMTNGEKKKENKIAVPNSFDGTPAKASTFLTEVDLYLMANDTIYPDDKQKILFMLSYMKDGMAARWMEAKTKEYKASLLVKSLEPADTKPEDQIHVLTWEEFLEDFNKAFKPVDQGTDSRLKMKKLKQSSGHIDGYITSFWLLVADTKYDDQALIDHFMAGMNLGLLKACLSYPDQPTTIKGWYTWARKYNNMWLTMKAITEGERTKQATKPNTKVNRLSDAESMEYR
ncbi:hypothetical protein Moror_8973 [Moniliophthora roreri MCA 2997]|uniref:Retrotransposon gag domain-containing protein n=2 Tax=Moniliophthora roreri TaxID=221103 RepID=V2XKD1_MONRO|nr:hypothetical protein Moror_8973 [Moniliophthora roreri MCA 2997]